MKGIIIPLNITGHSIFVEVLVGAIVLLIGLVGYFTGVSVLTVLAAGQADHDPLCEGSQRRLSGFRVRRGAQLIPRRLSGTHAAPMPVVQTQPKAVLPSWYLLLRHAPMRLSVGTFPGHFGIPVVLIDKLFSHIDVIQSCGWYTLYSQRYSRR